MEDQTKIQATIEQSFNSGLDFAEGTPLLIGVAGGSASGKTTLCAKIVAELGVKNCLIISLDSFYKGGITMEQAKSYNFDHPDALDWDIAYRLLKDLVSNKEVEIPIYNFSKHAREEETIKVKPCDLILFEGILALHDPRIVELMHFKIFVQCDDDVRLYRRLVRDVRERGRDVKGVLYQYNRFVKPAFNDFIKPSMKYANIIVPGNSDNSVAINFFVENLRTRAKRIEELKSNMKQIPNSETLLDSTWLQVRNEGNLQSGLCDLLKVQRIFLPTDDTVRTECLNLFNLLSKTFSKTLYKLTIGRFLTYGIKILLKYRAEQQKKLVITTYTVDENIIKEKVQNAYILGIATPILDKDAEARLRKQIESLSNDLPDLNIFILVAFADMDTMIGLTQWKSNVSVINNICLSDVEPLVKMLQDNCRTSEYDFSKDEVLIETLVDICRREASHDAEIIS